MWKKDSAVKKDWWKRICRVYARIVVHARKLEDPACSRLQRCTRGRGSMRLAWRWIFTWSAASDGVALETGSRDGTPIS